MRPKNATVKTHKADADLIMVKCEQCGRWTPVTVNIDHLEVEVLSFKTSYHEGSK